MTPQEACNFPLDLENHYGYVYCVTFPSNKKYIGQSKRPWKYRWKNHHCKTSFCPAMKNALQKYKEEELTWELLEYADDPQSLTDKETHYIQTLSTLSPDGYNVSLPCKAYPYPEEKRNRIRLGLALHHLHKTNPDATLEDAKKYIAEQDYKTTHKVKKGTPEWIERCKEASKKRLATLKAKGLTQKDISRKYYSTVGKREATRSSIKITVYETGEIFSSIAEFCDKYKVPSSSVSLCLQKKNKHTHGYHLYPTDITKDELDSYMTFWNTPIKRQRGILTCVETGKIYNTAKEAANELRVTTAVIYDAARFPSRTVNGMHFAYVQDIQKDHDGRRSVYCMETNKTYSSLRDAAREIFHVTDTERAHRIAESISRAAKDTHKSYKGYHFTYTQDPL